MATSYWGLSWFSPFCWQQFPFVYFGNIKQATNIYVKRDWWRNLSSLKKFLFKELVLIESPFYANNAFLSKDYSLFSDLSIQAVLRINSVHWFLIFLNVLKSNVVYLTFLHVFLCYHCQSSCMSPYYNIFWPCAGVCKVACDIGENRYEGKGICQFFEGFGCSGLPFQLLLLLSSATLGKFYISWRKWKISGPLFYDPNTFPKCFWGCIIWHME